MAESYAQAIAKAKARYKEAMDESAWDALAIVEEHGRPLATVCKGIAGEDWNKLRHRAAKLANSAGQTADERARAREAEWKRVRESHARAAMKDPEVAAKVIGSLTEPQRTQVYDVLEATQKTHTQRPSDQPAPRATATVRNVAALAALSDMHKAAKRAVEAAVFDKLNDHDAAGAEVIIRATESELAVWRENVGGGISDAAIRALMAEGV